MTADASVQNSVQQKYNRFKHLMTTDEKRQLKHEDVAGLPIGHVTRSVAPHFRSVLDNGGKVFAEVFGEPIPSYPPCPETSINAILYSRHKEPQTNSTLSEISRYYSFMGSGNGPGIKRLDGIIAMDFIHTVGFVNQVRVEKGEQRER